MLNPPKTPILPSPSSSPPSFFFHPANMRRKTRNTFVSLITSIFIFASFSFYLSRKESLHSQTTSLKNPSNIDSLLVTIEEDLHSQPLIHRRVTSFSDTNPDAILLPDWEILLVFPPGNDGSGYSGDQITCIFQNNDTSPAKLDGVIPFNNRSTFKCSLPKGVRRFRPLFQPIFSTSSPKSFPEVSPEFLFRWNFLAYESFSTENDVILFAKGVNHRQGVNRFPEDLRCIFSDSDDNSVQTSVTSSNQEVFRCLHPNGRIKEERNIKISIQIKSENKILPSVAYYAPPPSPPPLPLNTQNEKSLICACTMVYNVAKFLKEWVVYHSKIGVEKFLLYDNGSEDELQKVVKELTEKGFHVETIYWPWSKTQEAGFSHCAAYANETCKWMMYTDIDEFIFSPTWLYSPTPSLDMLSHLLPKSSIHHPVGEIMIKCYEFGPSNQRVHPINGVTQGYTCRTRMEQRHKSIVLLEAIDYSLLNVIHHFQLKNGYRVKKLSLEQAVVNHYKYQAWTEFKAKFRRRVSAYVIDWRQGMNPKSRDRTPGLGFEPIEPNGWDRRFCDVHDYRLQEVTLRWFGFNSSLGQRMVWQDL